MSRSQSGDIAETSSHNAATLFGNAENSYNLADKAMDQEQTGINDYAAQLAAYAAKDPYQQGGEFQTAENRVLADTAGGISEGARAALDAQAHRTGMNGMAANATAEAIADHNERNLAGQEADAEKHRIAGESAYGHSVLGATGELPGMEAKIAGQAAGLYGEGISGSNQAESIAAKASADNQSFWDQFGGAFAQNLGKTLGGGNVKVNMGGGGGD